MSFIFEWNFEHGLGFMNYRWFLFIIIAVAFVFGILTFVLRWRDKKNMGSSKISEGDSPEFFRSREKK